MDSLWQRIVNERKHVLVGIVLAVMGYVILTGRGAHVNVSGASPTQAGWAFLLIGVLSIIRGVYRIMR